MTDADFSSAADGSAGAGAPPAPAGAGAAETSRNADGDGNRFSGGEPRVADHAAARDASDRQHFPKSADGPVDIDQPAEWQTPAVRKELEELEELVKQREQPKPKPERPQDFPRSWATDADTVAVWNSLPEQARQQVARREQERDSATSRAQSEYIAKQRDIEVAVQRAESTAWAALLEIQPQLEQLGIRSNEDWQRLVQERPEDAKAIAAEMDRRQERVAEFQRLRGEAQQAAVQQQQQQIEQLVSNAKASWEQQKAREDAAAMKLIPELNDPAKAPAVQQRCMNYLKNDLGLSEQEISHLWNTDATFHSAKAQKLIHDASMWREAQEKARNATPKNPPRPQLGGMNGGTSNLTGDAALRAAADRGNMDAYFRLRGNSGARR
jgi:hypothetical protein